MKKVFNYICGVTAEIAFVGVLILIGFVISLLFTM
ncbi:hypothetical protein Mahau_2867 [Mahella australiensis 50-1 BON]|uniref:Uncharacterized protein n=1 Tax=Mahella australiensis (strain DSM 15567 / CIP 107919 / 50-1 BON) TaxID=697281 RepID=F4A0D0_MAHA5|nr:hypothetical protein Mahau_2867 [Mahella australiensis 50-1 BON]